MITRFHCPVTCASSLQKPRIPETQRQSQSLCTSGEPFSVTCPVPQIPLSRQAARVLSGPIRSITSRMSTKTASEMYKTDMLFEPLNSCFLEYIWLRSGQSRGRLHDGGLAWGPDFGAVLTPQIHGSFIVFGSGAGKVVDLCMTGGGLHRKSRKLF